MGISFRDFEVERSTGLGSLGCSCHVYGESWGFGWGCVFNVGPSGPSQFRLLVSFYGCQVKGSGALQLQVCKLKEAPLVRGGIEAGKLQGMLTRACRRLEGKGCVGPHIAL